MMRRLYIAGPITLGDRNLNVRAAVEAADIAVARGWVPFVPHLNCLWEDVSTVYHPYEFWLTQDFEWLRLCHALLRLPGESPGAEREIAVAIEERMPVYFGLENLPRAKA